MAYNQGGLIEAVDFNTFRSSTLSIFDVGNGDRGYGQVSGTAGSAALAVPSVTANVDPVASVEWTALQEAIERCSNHQTGSPFGTLPANLPPPAEFATNEIITAHVPADIYNLPAVIAAIDAARLTAPTASMTTTLNASVQSTGSSWATQARTVIDFTWPTADDARYFFNSGGEIQVQPIFAPSSGSPQNNVWNTLINSAGVVAMDYTSTTSSASGGSVASSIGYYDLGASFTNLFTNSISGGAYNNSSITIRALRLGVNGTNGDNGNRVRVEILMQDPHTNVFSDIVTGTLTIRAHYVRATANLNISPPTLSLNVGLNVV